MRFLRRPVAVFLAAALTLSGLLVTSGPAAAAGSTLFDQPFHDNTVTGIGPVAVPGVPAGVTTNAACLTAAGNSTTGPLRSCPTNTDPQGSGKLRLTPATTSREGGVFGAASVPTSQGLHVRFNTYQYGGSTPGADGLAFALAAVDPANPLAPAAIGQPGGSLGYSAAFSGTTVGLSNGYLGIGLDVFGNFSNSVYQGTGCTNPPYISTTGGRVPGQVVIRGPGRNGVGYCAINSTASTTSSPAIPLRASTRAASVVPVEVVANTTTSSYTTDTGITVPAGQYAVRFTPVGGTARTLTGALPVVSTSLYPSPTWLNASGYPRQLAFGWVGSTGAVTDFHEVDNTRAVSFNQVPDLNVRQTSAVTANPQPGDPVSYTVTAGVDPGATETVPISVTQTVPAGVTPLGAYGTGWTCAAPSGRSITCTSGNGPFPGGSTLPPITVVATVTGIGVTPAIIQTATVATSSSVDANPGYSSSTTAVAPLPAPTGVTVTPAQSALNGGIAVVVGGTNLTGATAILIGTPAEQAAGTAVVLLPCASGPAAGCFTTAADGTLRISSMPARSSAATVDVTVVTRGVAGSASFRYAAAPSFTFGTPPRGKAYQPYAFELTASGGVTPYVWSVSVGSLPPGLSLAPSTGLLSGTPTTAGTFSFTVRLTDVLAQSITRPVSLVIDPLTGLTISVPAAATLGAGFPGQTLRDQLGPVRVTDDRGPASGTWTVTVSVTNFVTGGGSAPETIPRGQVSYASGPALATTGVGTFLPQPGVTLDVPRTAAGWSGAASGNSATWNPTVSVVVPPQAVVGDYRATLTHSVF
ncbi:putative Ig domain-containing protein [Micromonospora musae]|uniref:putative Ig domain-containing protein n=1 Tax=Micromonospora musae TaxID=1894970 RepID=UPI0033F1A878